MHSLFTALVLPQWRLHPWRHALACAAVAIGVALGFAVHLINASALGEFEAAVRQTNGQPDVELRGPREGFDEQWYARIAGDARVAAALPVLEIDSYALAPGGGRMPLRIVGLDALQVAALAPRLLPRPDDSDAAEALIDPDALFLNATARRELGDEAPLSVQHAAQWIELRVLGQVAAAGAPLAVMDIAGAQAHFGRLGRLTRIDVRLQPGVDREAWLRSMTLPPTLRAVPPGEAGERVSNLSRAYRVNLSVLSLVALFTGGFLVFSVLSLSVAQRMPQLALLGVLGLAAQQRLRLVLGEAAALGVVGSALGLGFGTLLAWLALERLGGDLGSGFFAGLAPALRFGPGAALLYAALGGAAAMAGAWQPARVAQRLAPAQALKGLGSAQHSHGPLWLGPLLIAIGSGLALLPPVGDLPLAAYASVACLLIGGIACVPAAVELLLRAVRPPRAPAALLAIERARDDRHAATIAVAGVVASLALAVALTVMVASFRDAVSRWLDQVLPAELYVRTAISSSAADSAYLPPEFVAKVQSTPGVARVEALRVVQMPLDPARPPVALIARPLQDPAQVLPLVGRMVQPPANAIAVFVSEAVVSLYGASPGSTLQLPLPDGRRIEAFVQGVWRDYARQHGAIAMDQQHYRALTGDQRVNDLALWLAPGASLESVQRALRELGGGSALIEFATPGEIRKASLRIFDRSFAVTRWLQAVAIGIGLVGVAASFSAQVLARRREFGMLVHLGFTRAQLLRVVAGEGALWTTAGALLGGVLGIAVAVVLVHVVNPQSFHWTMELQLPWPRLAELGLSIVAVGTLTAALSARGAAGRDAVLAVKEDW